MINFFDRETPLTISMWDLSWLTCGHANAPYADLERRVAEAAELGYNCLRIDSFPHLYRKGEYTFPYNNQLKKLYRYGDVRIPEGYTVDVRKKVIQLADLCRRYDVWLALDAWIWMPSDTWKFEGLLPEVIPHGQEEKHCKNLSQAWLDSILMMREDGVLERAVYLSPMNEVPLIFANKFEFIREKGIKDSHDPIFKEEWSVPEIDPQIKQLTTWIGEEVKEAIAGDGIPLCYSTDWADNFAVRLPDFYDLIDVHFMPNMYLDEDDVAAIEKAGEGASKFSQFHRLETYDVAIFTGVWNRAWLKNCRHMYEFCHQVADGIFKHNTLSSGKELPVIMTETFGPCNHPDFPEVDWSGYIQYNEDAARLFAQYPFAGLSLSNMAEPLFSLWENKNFHQRSNHYIQSNVLNG